MVEATAAVQDADKRGPTRVAKTPTEPAAKTEAPAKPDRFTPLSESEFYTSVEFVMPQTAARPPVGTKLEHILKPEWWANIRGKYQQFTAGAIVQVYPKDGAWWAEVLVEQAGQGFARVKLLRHVELDPAAAVALVPDGYDIHPLPSGSYRAMRIKGGVILSDRCRTFEDALTEVRQDMRMLAA